MASHDDDPRDLLLAYRGQNSPPAGASVDNWQQLVRRIDAGEPAPPLALDEPRVYTAPRGRVWAFALLAAAAALLAARFVWPERFSAQGRDLGAAAPYHHNSGSPTQPVTVPAPRPSPAPPQPVSSDISPVAPPVAAPTLQRPTSHKVPRKTDTEIDLARELAAIRAAAQAVRDGDGAAALRHADDYLYAHPRGALVPEARLRRIEALCLLARPDQARREIDSFAADYPQSPLRERAAAACNSSHEIEAPRPLPGQ